MKKRRIEIKLAWSGSNGDEPCFECIEVPQDGGGWFADNEIHEDGNGLFVFVSFMEFGEDDKPIKHDLTRDFIDRRTVAIQKAKLELVIEAEKRMGVKFGKLHLCKFQLEHGMR